ncbi:MAG: AAA family ATPase [Verrucomicrobiota bacterium]
MPVCNYPICIWKDASGYLTAALLDLYSDIIVYGSSRQKALQELKSKIHQNRGWDGELLTYDDYELIDPEKVSAFKTSIKIRPQYKLGDRNFPLNETYAVGLRCFSGPALHSGMGICIIPTIGVGFEYYLQDEKKLKELVRDRLAERFQGITPEKLSELLPEHEVDFLNLPINSKRKAKIVPWAQTQSIEVPNLSAIAEPLTRPQISKFYAKPLNRHDDVKQVSSAIHHDQSNLIITGPNGIGKTTILCGAILDNESGRKNSAPKFWTTSAANIMSGMRYLGQWQERCETLISELASIHGALCFPSLQELVSTESGSTSTSLAAYLAHFIKQKQLRLIVEATAEELSASRRLSPEFVSLFRIHSVDSLPRSKNVEIIQKNLSDRAESESLKIEDGAVGALYRNFERFEPYKSMPGPACEFIKTLVGNAAKEGVPEITKAYITRKYQERTGLPQLILDDNQVLSLESAHQHFKQYIKGQDSACEQVADTVLKLKAGMNDSQRPVSVMLFSGPTGVGKTQLVKTLAKYLFGSEAKDRLVRLDMSEYSGYGAADRLIGTFSDEPAKLVRSIRSHPFSIVLLDEIEKAAPEIFDLFMGIFDEGRYTDRFGRLTHFNSSIIIMTSNLGVSHKSAPGFNADSNDSPNDFQKAITDFFRPEFYNRIDQIIPFSSLSPEQVKEIAQKEISDYQNREAFRLRQLSLAVSESVMAQILEQGYHPKLGARPLQRALEELITTPVSRFLSSNPQIANQLLKIVHDESGQIRVSATGK